MLNTSLLDNLIANTSSFSGKTAAQIAADPIFTTPTTSPRTGTVTWATIGSVWGAQKYLLLISTLGAMEQVADLNGAIATGVDKALTSGFDPSDPASTAMIAIAGPIIITATAGSATPVLQADIDAISTTTTYRVGGQPTADDVTASLARVAAKAKVQAVTTAFNAYRATNDLASLKTTIAAL